MKNDTRGSASSALSFCRVFAVLFVALVASQRAGAVDTQPPTAPFALSGTVISGTQINLMWGQSNDNVGVTGYRIERCQGAGCSSFVQVGTPPSTSYSDTGLTGYTSYTYRVRGADAAGNLSPYSATFTAMTFDIEPPTMPGSFTAIAVSGTQINLSWTPSTDNVLVSRYGLWRCQGVGCTSFVVFTNTANNVFSYSDTGLSIATSYSYRVAALDGRSNVSPYAQASATTLDSQVPTPPTNLSATATSATQINLSWTASTDNIGVTGYRIERCQGSSCTNFAEVGTSTSTTFSDAGLTNGTSYRYQVRATDAAGNFSPYSSAASAATPDVEAPSAPGGLAATAASGSQINLSWSASTDNVGVTGYRVERCQGGGCSNFAQVGATAATTFSDPGLTNGTSYSYRVRANDAAGNLGSYSATASASTLDTQAPTVPSGLAATAASGTQMNLSWTASTDNIGVSSYLIERCQGVSCATFAQVASSSSASYSDTGLAVATGYTYRVRATDAAGNTSGYSNTSSAITLDTQAPTAPAGLTTTVVSGTQIDLAWAGSSDNVGVTSYLIERCQGASCTTFTQVATATSPAYSDLGLANTTAYSYRVRATDAAGNLSAYSNVSSGTTPTPPDTQAPTAPTALSATVASGTQIDLSWTASTDNVGVSSYLIERCQGASCTTFAQLATSALATYSDTGLTIAASYTYRVRANDVAGNLSGYSNTASATTPDTQAPTVPGALTTTAISGSQINLSWAASTDNIAISSYLIERCQDAGCTTFSQLATATATTYNDTGLASATNYSYRVRAKDGPGNISGYSNTSSATTPTGSGSSASVTYAYDANGRLVQIVSPTFNAAQAFVYDAAGNIVASPASSLGSLSVAGLSASQGSPGSQVTLYGTGFSATASLNAVLFNGVPATVISASATQLTVVVPAGATSGSITITVGGSSTTSTQSFTVLGAGTGPAITTISPAIGAAGTAVTISGSGFATPAILDKVRFNVTSTSATSASSGSLTAVVSAGATSGKVSVITPNGIATSGTDFVVPPSGYSAANIASTGRIATDGTGVALTLSTANTVALRLFDGAAGDLLSIGVTSDTIASSTIKVFKPDGSLLVSATITAAGQGIQLPKLASDGTYSLVVDPGANTGNITVALYKPLQAALTIGGSPVSVSLTPAGRRAIVTFSGTQGAYATVTLSGVTLSSGTATIFSPGGSIVGQHSFSTAGLTLAPQLAADGTYSILIDPAGSLAGDVQIAAVTSASPTLVANQPATTLSMTGGVAVTRTFVGTQGQSVTLAIGEVNNGIYDANVSIVGPDGNTVCTTGFIGVYDQVNNKYVSPGTACLLKSLPKNGTYTVTVTSMNTGSVLIALSTPVQATLDLTNPPVSVNMSVPGQGATLTFAGTAGDTLSLAVQQTTSTPAYPSYAGSQFTLSAPDGTPAPSVGTNVTVQNGLVVKTFAPLPLTGTYRVDFTPSAPASGTVAFTLSRPFAGGTLAMNDTPENIAIARRGQGLIKTFTGTVGQPVIFNLTEVNGGITDLTYTLLSPSGVQVSMGSMIGSCLAYSCLPGNDYRCAMTAFPCDIWNGRVMVPPLPEAGVYTLLVSQTTQSWNPGAGTGTLTIQGMAPVSGAMSVNGSAVPMTISGARPMIQVFAATGGQSLTVSIQSTDSPLLGGGNMWVLSPAGAVVASRPYSIPADVSGTKFSGTVTLDTGVIAASGTYTLVVESYGNGGSLNFQVASH